MSDLIFSDDKALLQVERIHGWLASSYWSPGIERSRIETAIAHSHCLGVYRAATQIGFARMITDFATFAWLADVWVDESARGLGIGKQMVRWFLDRPDYAAMRRVGLVTRDAHSVYEAVGFHALLAPDRYMEKLSTEFTALLTGGTA